MAACELPRNEPRPLYLRPKADDLCFQVLDWYIPENDKAARNLKREMPEVPRDPNAGWTEPPPPETYTIYMFGCTAEGHSVSAKVSGFQPYFFVRPPSSWTTNPKKHAAELRQTLLYERIEKNFRGKTYMGTTIPRKYQDHLIHFDIVYRKDFWGFTNGREFPFIRVQVASMGLFNILKRYFEGARRADEAAAKKRYGEAYEKTRLDSFKLYEANIEPFIRFIHDQNISPCGWVRLPSRSYEILESAAEVWSAGRAAAAAADSDADEDDAASQGSQGNPEKSRTIYNVAVAAKHVLPMDCNKIAPLLVASWDIECTSSHGDFPLAHKSYGKLMMNMVQAARKSPGPVSEATVRDWIRQAFIGEHWTAEGVLIHQVYPKEREKPKTRALDEAAAAVVPFLNKIREVRGGTGDAEAADAEDAETAAPLTGSKATAAEEKLSQEIVAALARRLPPVEGDPVIQIGTTVHRYGSDEIIYRHICVLGTCEDIPGVVVETFDTEAELIMGWRDFIQRLDPDLLIGYNIFQFDNKYLWDRARELGILFNPKDPEATGPFDFSLGMGRLVHRRTDLIEQRLSSSALGDNFLNYMDLDGIVQIDMMKVMQREHKLDSYKLDTVASIYLGDHKDDLKPREIFEKFGGTAADRAEIARYCIQDCALVNRLLHKLKVLENNCGMGTVCNVPLSYLFLRGQGVKIFSLVSKECRSRDTVIPVIRPAGGFGEDEALEDEEGYEGAIVLPPKEGMYLDDPITVFDYASLYPSSMIERNLSHDCFVVDDAYRNEPGIEYITVSYDIYEGKGDQKRATGKANCTFAQLPEGKKGIIPSILNKLLTARKTTRKKIEYETLCCRDGRELSGLVSEVAAGRLVVADVEKNTKTEVAEDEVVERRETYDAFEKAVLDALQLAYKITANSLYGQIGARTSPIYWKEIAACTTATGRERIELARDFMQKHYDGEIIYGDTDSVFIRFPNRDPADPTRKLVGREALAQSIATGQKAAKAIKAILPPPQSLEYEKTFWPFILFSKKRYVGNLYEDDAYKKPKQKSMGIVLKRRDNAPIVKQIYGGIIDILLNERDLAKSVEFFRREMAELVAGRTPMSELIISKTLKGDYKDPDKIAHRVLADRMTARDPGNRPMPSDRLPFVYILPPPGMAVESLRLQGDRIEHPDYIREHALTPNYRYYITNQLMNPISQIYGLCLEQLPGYSLGDGYWMEWDETLKDHRLYSSEAKRKNRITQMRIDEVCSLLFDPFLVNLPDPYAPPAKVRGAAAAAKKTALQISGGRTATILNTLLPDTVLHLLLDVGIDGETKRYVCVAHLYEAAPGAAAAAAPIWKLEYAEARRKTITKSILFRNLADEALAYVRANYMGRMNEGGLIIGIHCKTILKLWRDCLSRIDTLTDEAMQVAIKNGDIGEIKAMQEAMGYAGLFDAREETPYILKEWPGAIQPTVAAAELTERVAPAVAAAAAAAAKRRRTAATSS